MKSFVKTIKIILTVLLIFSLSCTHEEKDEENTPNYILNIFDLYGITFSTIPAGTFNMGESQGGGRNYELPVHSVTLGGFDISIYEITNSQYAQYLTEALASGDITATSRTVKGAWDGLEYLDLGESDCEISYSNGTFIVDTGREDHPVIYVTWYGAKSFALHYGLDLPTEAEWEYSCRSATETKYYTGNFESNLATAGWYYENANYWTHPVGEKVPNAWGLYDMHGNVLEWCHDLYDSGYYASSPSNNPTGAHKGFERVLRGGSWSGGADSCRSADRPNCPPDGSGSEFGFRVVRRVSGVQY